MPRLPLRRHEGLWIRRLARIGTAAISILLLAGPALGELGTDLECPKNVPSGSSAQLMLRLENQSCEPLQARVLSTMVGNANDTADGVAILGPEVAASDVVVPAATDEGSGSCIGSFCDGSFLFCVEDADCACQVITPGSLEITVSVPTPIPASLDGSVIHQFVVTEAASVAARTQDTCLIAVPEPGLRLQQLAATTALLALLMIRLVRSAGGSSREIDR